VYENAGHLGVSRAIFFILTCSSALIITCNFDSEAASGVAAGLAIE